MHDEQAECSRGAGVDDPPGIAERAVGPWIEHIQRGHAPGLDRRSEGGHIGRSLRAAWRARREAERTRAVHVGRVHGRHDELRARRLGFLGVAPAHRDDVLGLDSLPVEGRETTLEVEVFGEPLEQEQFFVRCMRRQQKTDAPGRGRPGRGESVGDLGQEVVPGDRALDATHARERDPKAIVALNPVILEAPDVAHPVAVDGGVEPWREPDQARPLRPLGFRLDPRRGVAALRAQRADRVGGVRVVPRARLEPVVSRGDRADGAHVHEVAGEERMHALLLERRDLAAVSAVDDVDLRVALDVAHEAHAPRAEDAAVAVEHQRRAEVDIGLHALAVESAARKLHAALVRPECVRKILERALAALVAHGAVEGVVDQQQLEHAGARRHDIGRACGDDHAVAADRGARRLQLRHLLDFDDADTARAVDADARVIAVVRNLDAALDGGLQHRPAFLNFDRPAVDCQRDGVH